MINIYKRIKKFFSSFLSHESVIEKRMNEIAKKYNLTYLEWFYVKQNENEKSNFFDYEFAQSKRHQYDYKIPAHKWMRRPYIDFNGRYIHLFREEDAITWIDSIELTSPSSTHAPYNKHFCQIADWFPATDLELVITNTEEKLTKTKFLTLWIQTNKKFNYGISTFFPAIIPVSNTDSFSSAEYICEREYVRLNLMMDALVWSLDNPGREYSYYEQRK